MNSQGMQDENDNSASVNVWRVLLKGLLLFFACNLIFAFSNADVWLGKISAYNYIFPGRQRLPWSENPTVAYNLSLNNLDAMFASHEISGATKAEDEFRVILIGDSSTWGFLLPVEDMLSEQLNLSGITTESGKNVRVYNFGFPTISLTKDLLILDRAMQYEPDLIVWLVTLEAFPRNKQIFTPLVQNNPSAANYLIESFQLGLNEYSDDFITATFWDKTIIGQRKELANLFRLQLYGVMWAATSIDQDIYDDYEPRKSDFEADDSYYDYSTDDMTADTLSFDVITAGIQLAGDVPVLIVNEPIFISEGENSDIRYNHLYPRWAYDLYRILLAEESFENDWQYADFWDFVLPEEFTNTAIHMTPYGTSLLAEHIEELILNIASQ